MPKPRAVESVPARSTTFTRSGTHVTRAVAGETLVVPIRASTADLDSLYVFNETGAAIWGLLDGPRRVEEIVRALADEFEVAEVVARADAERFLEALSAAGLVESKTAP